MPNFRSLARLEVPEKFLWVGWGGGEKWEGRHLVHPHPGMFMTPSLWGDRCHVKICSGNPGAGAWLSLAKKIGSLKLILALGFKYLSLNLNSHHSRSTVRTKWSCLAFNTKWSHLTPINLSGLLCHSRFTTKTGIQTLVGGTSEVQKGVEHKSIAPRRKWTELIIADGFGTSLPHLSQFP